MTLDASSVALNEEDAALVKGVLARDRRALAKTITLLESTRSDHRERGQVVLDTLLPHSGKSIRVGISGVPGVGKSTFIEALGMLLIGRGHRVAVLAIDPSSSISGGSILGDKTRMERLSMRDEAFIRPSPASGSLGGVADKTREAMLVCEAASFDIVIVETVGVGQSETAVAAMTDVFVLLQLPNAGDDLQAIKKGIVELADIVVYNKTDIDIHATEMAVAQMQSALALLRPPSPHWKVPVLKTSATRVEGIEEFWKIIERYRKAMEAHGAIAERRQQQALAWMWHLIESGLQQRFNGNPGVKRELAVLTKAVQAGTITPSAAARQLLGLGK